jgi:arylsulfatase A-like enzyme
MKPLSLESERKMKFSKIGCIGLAMFLIGMSVLSCSPPPKTKKTNIVFFVYDCTRFDRYSINGNPRKTSPFFDTLAKKSIYFKNGIAPATWTFPSHAVMFTGLRNHQLKVDIENENYLVIDPNVSTIAECLSGQGYTTISFPDHFYFGPVNASLSRGFRYFDIIFNPLEQPGLSFTNCYNDILIDRYVTVPADAPGALDALKAEYKEILKDNTISIDDMDKTNEKFPDIRGLLEESNYMDIRYRALYDVLKENQDNPVFVYFNLHSSPIRRTNELMNAMWFFEYLRENNLAYADPVRFDSLREEDSIEKGLLRQDYIIAFYDAICEKLVDYLYSNGFEDTALVIASDHGEAHCEHGENIYKHAYAIPWEYSVRAPLLVHLPGADKDSSGIVVEERVSLADVFYTILDIAGFDEDDISTEGLVGRSLLKRVDERDFEEYEVSESFSAFPYSEIADILPELGDKYYFERRTPLSGNTYAIYKDDYKLIYIPTCKETAGVYPLTLVTPDGQPVPVRREFELKMLFNLKDDPDEKIDLSKELPEMVDEFVKFYEQHKEIETNVRLADQNRLGYDRGTARQIRALGYLE